MKVMMGVISMSRLDYCICPYIIGMARAQRALCPRRKDCSAAGKYGCPSMEEIMDQGSNWSMVNRQSSGFKSQPCYTVILSGI